MNFSFFCPGATAKSGVERAGSAGAGPDGLRPVAPSISHNAAAKPLGVAPSTDAKSLPSGSRPARQRLGLFGASQALPDAMPGAAASKADQAAEAPQAVSRKASTSSASTAASDRYSKFMAALPGRGQLPAKGGLSERGQQPKPGRRTAAQIPKEGTSSSTSRAETSPPDASHSNVPGQGPSSSVKAADLSLPKAAGFPLVSEGLRQATAADATPSANATAVPAALSAAATSAANVPSAPSAAAAAAAAAAATTAAEPTTATGASSPAGSSTAADSQTSASQTAATKSKLRPSSKFADGAKSSLQRGVWPTTSGRAAAAAAAAADADAAAADADADSPAAEVNTAPFFPAAKLVESDQQQLPSVSSDSSLPADSMSTADMGATDATSGVSRAVRATTDAIPSDSTAELTAAAAIPFATSGSSSQADDDADDFFAVAGDTPASRPAAAELPQQLPQHLPSAAAIDSLAALPAPADASSTGIQPQKQLDAVGPGEPNAVAVRQPWRTALPARHRGSADAVAPQPPFLQQATAAAPPAYMPDHHAEAPAGSRGSAVPATSTAPAAAAAKPRNKADVSPHPAFVATDRTMPTAVDPVANSQAEAAFSTAGQLLSYGGSEETQVIPLDEEKEQDKAEQQSGFVPIPFGGSSSRPSFAATAVTAPFGSHADMDSIDDSFFDSIGTGTPHAQTLVDQTIHSYGW